MAINVIALIDTSMFLVAVCNRLYKLFQSSHVYLITYTVWPEILAGNLFWRIGGFESNPPIFHPPRTSQCDVIIIAKS